MEYVFCYAERYIGIQTGRFRYAVRLTLTPLPPTDDWNAFGCGLSQSLILSTARVIKHTGLKDLGYHYIVLDDCWSSSRGSNGVLIPDATKFPNGMSYLGEQLHADGFGFGIYSSAGTKTVRNTPSQKWLSDILFLSLQI